MVPVIEPDMVNDGWSETGEHIQIPERLRKGSLGLLDPTSKAIR